MDDHVSVVNLGDVLKDILDRVHKVLADSGEVHAVLEHDVQGDGKLAVLVAVDLNAPAQALRGQKPGNALLHARGGGGRHANNAIAFLGGIADQVGEHVIGDDEGTVRFVCHSLAPVTDSRLHSIQGSIHRDTKKAPVRRPYNSHFTRED